MATHRIRNTVTQGEGYDRQARQWNDEKHFGCTESYDIADIQTDSRNGGYYTVGKNKQKIAEYIRRQMDEDKLGEQLTMFGKDDDPFKGGR